MVHKTVAGVLPDEWGGALIKNVSKVVRGSSPRPAGSPLYFDGDFLPWATVADLTNSDDMYLTSTKSMLTEEGSERTRITDPGTLMLTNSGATLGVPKISKIRCGANDGIAMLLDLNGIATEYAYYYLSSKTQYFRDVVAPGVGQPNLNTDLIGDFPIPVPPLSEQKKIAQILSAWDKAITTTEQLLANSQQQKKSLMQQLLTGKKRLLDKNGVRFSGEWKKPKLSKLFERVTKKNNGQSTNVVTISGQHGLIRQDEFFKKTVASETLDGYFLIRRGQFAYNKSYSNGYPMGAIKRLNRYEDGVVTTLYICFEITDSTKTDSDYWEHYFESGLLNKGLSQIAHEGGRAHGLLNVKPSDFLSLVVSVPCLEEQKKIAEALSASAKEVATLQKKIDTLKKEKKALMQNLLTGKVRVRTIGDKK
jgi:type I restriction enzyme, S subunit